MNVKDTFWQAFNLYPSLFQTRADVINQLFFVIGNGYEWRDGELCGVDGDQPKTLDDITEERIARELQDRSRVRLAQSAARILGEPIPTEEEALEEQLNEEFAIKIGPVRGKPRDFYPVCQYSKLCNVPADVRPDWLRLAREAAQMLVKAENRPSHYDPDCNRKNAAIGRKVLAELERRFPRKGKR